MRNYQANGELPLLAELKPPAAVDKAVLAGFGDDEEVAVRAALTWAWLERRVRGMTQRAAAERCGIKSQHFSLMLKGSKYLPLSKLNAFEQTVGNTAVSQTIERFRRLRDERLRHELAELIAHSLTRAA